MDLNIYVCMQSFGTHSWGYFPTVHNTRFTYWTKQTRGYCGDFRKPIIKTRRLIRITPAFQSSSATSEPWHKYWRSRLNSAPLFLLLLLLHYHVLRILPLLLFILLFLLFCFTLLLLVLYLLLFLALSPLSPSVSVGCGDVGGSKWQSGVGSLAVPAVPAEAFRRRVL